MRNSHKASGSCLCGKITFEFDFPSLWCAHCYCSLCRKAHGAGLVTWIGVPELQFRLTSDSATLRSFASSAQATREFCSSCGSSLFFRSGKWPGEVHIALACLDTPADRHPQTNVFTDNHVPWLELVNLPADKA